MKVDVNRFVQIALSTGLILSFIILLWGSVLYLLHPAAAGPGKPGSLVVLLRGVASLDPRETINLGLLVLLVTPVARVLAAMAGFAIEGDRKYALISLAVLAILALSAVVGR